MSSNKYSKVWLCFVDVKAKKGKYINDMVDVSSTSASEKYIGAWINILVKASTINEVLKIIPRGLKELGFKVGHIDKIENLQSPVEAGELNDALITEVNWLLRSKYIFKISDKLFPYSNIV